jgi:hypothetical protein
MEWNPPWRSKRIATGEVFAANVELVDYFRQTYGLTPTFLAEEEQRARQAAQELQKLQASLPANHRVGIAAGAGAGRSLTAEEQLAHNAKAAYLDFYHSFVDKVMSTEPGTSPNVGPAAPLTNSGVSAGRHR